jgi:hypothetical protein
MSAKELVMYIGLGTIVLILAIIVVLMLISRSRV